MWKHWVVRARTPEKPFRDFENCQSLWSGLSGSIPETIAAILMPNHLHLIVPATAPGILCRLTGLSGRVSRRLRKRALWQTIPEPAPIPDALHLKRQVRYIALNPCRAGLCSDPLEWHWSTYREIMGAVAQKRAAWKQLASLVGMPERDFQVRFHAYVSGDPSVQVDGTPFPARAVPSDMAEHSIGEIIRASAAALERNRGEIQQRSELRRFFIHFAWRHGWRSPSHLARLCRITPQAVHHALKQPPPGGLAAGDVCLGDVRLRTPFSTERPHTPQRGFEKTSKPRA